jgi:hypothetical protein
MNDTHKWALGKHAKLTGTSDDGLCTLQQWIVGMVRRKTMMEN